MHGDGQFKLHKLELPTCLNCHLIRLFEIYRNAASYQAHLQSPHFKKYKE